MTISRHIHSLLKRTTTCSAWNQSKQIIMIMQQIKRVAVLLIFPGTNLDFTFEVQFRQCKNNFRDLSAVDQCNEL